MTGWDDDIDDFAPLELPGDGLEFETKKPTPTPPVISRDSYMPAPEKKEKKDKKSKKLLIYPPKLFGYASCTA